MNAIIKKSLLYSAIALAVGGVTSCADRLDEVIYSELTPDNAFVTKEDAIAAVNGIYDPLISVTNRSIFYLNDMPTDACYMKEMPTELWNERQMDNNQDVTASYRGYFRIISRANIALDKIPTISLEEFDENDNIEKATALRDRLLAEASFMRGFAYYQLSDIFYTVPLIIDSETSTDAILPPATIAEIEKQIDIDLNAAKLNLPASFADRTDAGRPTLGAAAGFLCRLHMRIAGRMRQAGGEATSEWKLALEYANEVLALEGIAHSLQPHVWDIFDPADENCKYNNELIFSVRSNPNGGGGTSDIGMNFTPWEYDCGWNLFSIPLDLAWRFDQKDERYTKLVLTDFTNVYNVAGKIFKRHRIPEAVEKIGTVYSEDKGSDLNSTDDDKIIYEIGAAYTQKYKYLNPLTYNYKTGNNMPLLRLADIILCKAEILNELDGPSQNALDLLNRIRNRAFQDDLHKYNLADYPTKESLRSAICDERLLELNNEGVRRPDLIRMGLWKDRMDKYVAAIKVQTEWSEKNAAAKADLENPGGAPHKFDYSSNWKVYPSDLTENDIRRYYPAPKREMDLNPALENCRDFSK